jgi:hypothetical protein
VSIAFKAFQFPREVAPRWFAVDEITTVDATVEAHVREVLACARDKWHVNVLDRHGRPADGVGQMLVRADPYSDQGEAQPDRSVYTIWRNHKVVIHPAAYRPGSTAPTPIKKEAGIDLVNTLLCPTEGPRRLCVACDENRQPAAPKLVEAFEMSQRDEANRAERDKKDEHDLSHWPAATRYALWSVERPRLGVRRDESRGAGA